MGGKTQVVQAAAPPAPPSVSSNISDFIANYPRLVELDAQYGPRLAQQQLDQLNQYGSQFAQSSADIAKQLSPYTYGLQEQLAKEASDGLQAGVPDNLRNEYLNQLRAELGPNAGSPIGGDYVSSNLLRLSEDYKNNFRNIGLSLSGRLPINQYGQQGVQMGAGGAGQISGGFTPNSVLDYTAGTYGPYASASMQGYGRKAGGFNAGNALAGAGLAASLFPPTAGFGAGYTMLGGLGGFI